MGIKSDYHWIQDIVEKYRTKLGEISDLEWHAEPSSMGWSYSEVYYHIFDASQLSLIQLNNSIEGRGKVKPTAFVVRLILFLGMLPPGKKFKAPKMLTERLKKVSKNDMLIMIDAFLKQVALVYPRIEKANLSFKAPHPVMGYLNSQQWLRFIGIHLNHHLKQVNRIEKSFKFTSLQQ